MKICIISNAHPANDVRLYYKLAISLAKQHQVWLITATGLPNNTHNPYQIVVEPDAPRPALKHIQNEALKIKPDLVICVEPLTLLIARVLKRKLNCRVIFDVHEFYADAFAERFPFFLRFPAKLAYLAILKHLQRIADGLFAVNQDVLNQLLGSDQAGRGSVFPNYPVKNVWDYACDTPGALAQLCEMRFDLIYAGGLTVQRGIFKILKVATLLKRDFPELKILILGKFFDPKVEADFNRSINDYNLNTVIYYQQWIPAEKIGLLLKRCRYGLWLFNPRSRRFRLSTPLKVLEYLSAGLPVITIKTPHMKALIEYNKLGSLTSYHARSIAATISKMLHLDETEYHAMSQRCLELSATRFNWEALEPQLFAAISRAMQR
ncbi:MAG TPA: glycosyltransferase [Candidatus Cloacimonadota bacterium]|nr:glycosyltransferase [Candidatus Cloacimonadota bacterium]